MFRWIMKKLTGSPVDEASRLRIVRDDPRALGDKPDHVPARTPES